MFSARRGRPDFTMHVRHHGRGGRRGDPENLKHGGLICRKRILSSIRVAGSRFGAVALWRGIPAPPPPPRTVCTKYELVNALSAHFPELQFFWNTVNDLDRANADFQRFAQSLGISEAQIDAIFAALEA